MKNGDDKLHKLESLFYFFVWSSVIAYAIYKLSLTNTYFSNHHDLYADFAPGWTWIGRKQDVSDQEWRVWLPLLVELVPWIFFHHIISYIIKATSYQTLLCYWYLFMSISFLYYYLGALGMLCILAQPILLYFLTYKCNRLIIWMIHVSFLYIIHLLKTPNGFFQSTLSFSDEEHYILTLTMCWIQLRSISYSFDNIDSHFEKYSSNTISMLDSFLWKLAYCLYLPTLSLGPLILYHEFIDSVQGPFKFLDSKKLGSFILNLIRYTFWIYFTKFSLHFVYFNAIQFYPEVVETFNPWALYGLGYCMGQFFLIKYVIIYGLNHNLCMIDNIKAPTQPKCIARIHLYSDMWKYFDRGLYQFLVRYIYRPLLTLNFNKLLASMLCFVFVFIWHGMQTNIFVWALLNFIGLTMEDLARSVGESKYYSKMQKQYFSLLNTRRFNCALASPLLAMSAVSNFYFFAGQEIGNIFIQRTLNESWNTLLLLLFFLYCCCQVSVDVKNWETKRKSMKFEYCQL